MLDDFITTNRDAIITGARARVASRINPKQTDLELANGIPVFIDQLGDALRLAEATSALDREQIDETAGRHGRDLFQMGLTIAQVVHDYGDVCQVVTELALHQTVPITSEEFRRLNLCLDDAIAGAVTAWAHERDLALREQGTERLGRLAHELRNFLNSAVLAYDTLKRGDVAVGGTTGQLLGRSLTGLRDLVDRALADVRLDVGIERFERIFVADFLAEIEIGAAMHARSCGLQFMASTVDRSVTIDGDRQILVAAVWNLLQNAFKFTRKGGTVWLRTQVTPLRVLMEVEDECGGLPPGKVEELFTPYSQRGKDRTGLGLGLPICLKAAKANGGEISVHDIPGKGCVFTLNLPKKPPPPLSVAGAGNAPGAASGARSGPMGIAKARSVGADLRGRPSEERRERA